MIIFKPYTSIKDFLLRFTILKVGKLHIRLHRIVSADGSTLYHNHPFHYVSIILSGGYTESVMNGKDLEHSFLSVIIRNQNVYHRINIIKPRTLTLFIAWGDYGWQAINMHESNDNGLFQRIINQKNLWCKKQKGIWFIGHADADKAIQETRHSIHQTIKPCY
jgi:hypothetical protein